MAASERIFIEPAERRHAMLDIIASARSRLILSLFRCNDDAVLEAVAAAVQRGVKVDALVTRRAKGGRKNLKKLWSALAEMGAVVHWYADPVVKYHAKYLVVDECRAMIATLNPTRKCFSRTWDFVLVSEDAAVVRSVSTLFALDTAGDRILARHRISPRLVIAPEDARARLQQFIRSARRTIQVLDHKLSDPDVVSLLRERRAAGVEVSVIGRNAEGPLVPHGKLLILDESRAVLGSVALSTLSLDFRREVSVVIDDRAVLSALNAFYRELSERNGGALSALPGDAA